jgi:hypothetical protein
MVPQLVEKESPNASTTLLDPLIGVKCTEGSPDPSRKTGEDSRGLGIAVRAFPLPDLLSPSTVTAHHRALPFFHSILVPAAPVLDSFNRSTRLPMRRGGKFGPSLFVGELPEGKTWSKIPLADESLSRQQIVLHSAFLWGPPGSQYARPIR